MNDIEECGDLEVFKPKSVTISSINVQKVDIRKYWTRDQINNMISQIEDSGDAMLLRFLWLSGVRISEAIGLKKKDIDIQNYVMTVSWLKNRKYKYRVVPLHPRLRDILQLYIAGMNQEDRLFPYSRVQGWRIVKKWTKGYPHQFRHSFAVNWLRCNGDIVILHRILGHSKIQTTMEYLKIVPIDQGKELLKIQFD